jgi:hypothetical protein
MRRGALMYKAQPIRIVTVRIVNSGTASRYHVIRIDIQLNASFLTRDYENKSPHVCRRCVTFFFKPMGVPISSIYIFIPLRPKFVGLDTPDVTKYGRRVKLCA